MIALIDVSGFAYRSFYAFPSMKHNDQEVGALYGFCSSMKNIIDKFKDFIFVAAMDYGKKTFRHDLYPEYKSNRKETPEQLINQIPLIQDACNSFGFNVVKINGYEADDIIATYASKLPSNQKVVVISSDKDLMQLMSNNVSIYDPIKRSIITQEDVVKKFGVTSDKILDFLSLVGDQSDNIPGIQGIGPKTAANLLNEFGSLENIVQNLTKLPKGKKFEKIKEDIDRARLSKKLATLITDLEVTLELRDINVNGIKDFLALYDFKSLLK